MGTTCITNGCYRLHPVEWNIGEAAGLLAVYAIHKKVAPQTVKATKTLLTEFQQFVRKEGINGVKKDLAII
ncbi:FAD-dependent oxidoreductase [Olivibacter domesticus]|uniref:FAD-dependent oxidoreductase n=1 Tax=Olivibacter domesticus TaxID=407022 RepID=UPI0021D07EFB|nr:FAD-dependent oxidoreductase [Olivibacter domesticus]